MRSLNYPNVTFQSPPSRFFLFLVYVLRRHRVSGNRRHLIHADGSGGWEVTAGGG